MPLLDPILPVVPPRSSSGEALRGRRAPGDRRGRRQGHGAARRHRPEPAGCRVPERGNRVLRRDPRPAVHLFPDLETLPYDSFSAHPDITSARLKTLAELPRARAGVWVVAIETLLQRLAPRSYIEAHSLKVHVGETARPRGVARAVDSRGLRGGNAGGRARRVRGARLPARCISHGLGQPVSHRPAGPGYRQHPRDSTRTPNAQAISSIASSCWRRVRRP